ncbi:hypothetical protein PtA15_6A542 [Puccinia triticina]|uniref:Uncharacterized protein n=1 Tax=Puccinia triticina TaxID=208348 RepID=A0ABY7CL14_9BASI|nr:uncharacterized protein PtA15_6A542 [Puccinia triticina]WAQ85913.1 hypothetical protein PtA15_6A542 [Puccinia triticina]
MPGETLRSKATLSIPLGDQDSFFIHGQWSFAKGHISIGTTDLQDIQIQLAALTNNEALINLMTVSHVSSSPAQSFDQSKVNHLSGGKITLMKHGFDDELIKPG